MSLANRLDKLESRQPRCTDPDCNAGRRWTFLREDFESTTPYPAGSANANSNKILPPCPICGCPAGIIRVIRESAVPVNVWGDPA